SVGASAPRADAAVGPDDFLELFLGGFLSRKHVAELSQADSLAVRLAGAVLAGLIDSPFRIKTVTNFILARVIIRRIFQRELLLLIRKKLLINTVPKGHY
ncbi:MAG: hypothetical protein OXC62_13215, partial [Aestuariivita sp.]|nr:hypothetical protein [Aestuariivita sp.]